MPRCPRLPRVGLFALVAFVAAVSGSTGATAAQSGSERAAEMRRKGCCCVVRPISGRCCEPGAAPAASGMAVNLKGGFGAAASGRVVLGPRTGTCACGSNRRPAPSDRPLPRPAEPTESHRAGLAAESSVPLLIHPALPDPCAMRPAPPSASFLHLHTTHLLI